MAEFCYNCYKKFLKGNKEENELIISKYLDLCEGCGKYKHVVVRYKNSFEIIVSRLFGN